MCKYTSLFKKVREETNLFCPNNIKMYENNRYNNFNLIGTSIHPNPFLKNIFKTEIRIISRKKETISYLNRGIRYKFDHKL